VKDVKDVKVNESVTCNLFPRCFNVTVREQRPSIGETKLYDFVPRLEVLRMSGRIAILLHIFSSVFM